MESEFKGKSKSSAFRITLLFGNFQSFISIVNRDLSPFDKDTDKCVESVSDSAGGFNIDKSSDALCVLNVSIKVESSI